MGFEKTVQQLTRISNLGFLEKKKERKQSHPKMKNKLKTMFE